MENKEILTESISELSKNNFDTSLISDNKLCFVIDEALYRVRMPNQGEQSLTEHKRNLMQLEYLKQEGCITRNQLIAQLKNSGVVDIEQLEETRENLTKELKKFWFMLATKDSEDKNKITEYSETIGKIQEKLQNLAMDIATYLSPCLESRLEKFYIEFVTSVCTEQRIGEEWKRVWNSFDEFNNADTTISNKALANFTWLLLNKR
jgi:hypothetical protein